jgi:hypothetical protein
MMDFEAKYSRCLQAVGGHRDGWILLKNIEVYKFYFNTTTEIKMHSSVNSQLGVSNINKNITDCDFFCANLTDDPAQAASPRVRTPLGTFVLTVLLVLLCWSN